MIEIVLRAAYSAIRWLVVTAALAGGAAAATVVLQRALGFGLGAG